MQSQDSYIECKIINGKKEGLCKYYEKGCLKIICNYLNDNLIGEYKEYSKSFIKATGPILKICNYIQDEYNNSLLHGEYKIFFPNGTIQISCNYINGYIEGELIKNDNSGNTILISYYTKSSRILINKEPSYIDYYIGGCDDLNID